MAVEDFTKYRFPVLISGLYDGEPAKIAFFQTSGYRSLLAWEYVQHSIKKNFEDSKQLNKTISETLMSAQYYSISKADATSIQQLTKSVNDVDRIRLDVMSPIDATLDDRCLLLIAYSSEEEVEENGSGSSAKGSSKKRAKKST